MRTTKNVVAVTLCLLALAAAPAAAVRTLENFSLDAGRVPENRIGSPVWDAAGADPVVVEKLAWKPGPDYLPGSRGTSEGVSWRAGSRSFHGKVFSESIAPFERKVCERSPRFAAKRARGRSR